MAHARVFNLSREDLMSGVIEPWLRGAPIAMGEREWEPGESELTVLGGRRMEGPDLQMGQGWSNAQRSGEDVTREMLSQAPAPSLPLVFEAEAADPEKPLDELRPEAAREIEWAEAKRRIDGRDPEIAAIVLVTRRGQPGPSEPRS